jgi:FlaA1/EpsC-like NDP-sugar epimerase
MDQYLSRKPVAKGDEAGLASSYRDRIVLITGAAGSIGSELARQLCRFKPAKLFLLDRDENGLFEAGLELREHCCSEIHEVLADVRQASRVSNVLKACKADIVFHAAAYKHVPLAEQHPSEAILNNVIGSRNLIRLSAELGVETFVQISTDKAVNPSSVMGASKRLAELILRKQALSARLKRYCCVRFGNVLGSRASVVPLFERQIERRKPITVTHPEMQRYFMTIPEAVALVIQAARMDAVGDVFVLDMGDPVKIADLARRMIEQAGLRPEIDIPIQFSAPRPGEKLVEKLFSEEETSLSTGHPMVFRATSAPRNWDGFDELISELESAALNQDDQVIYRILEACDIGYSN